MNNKDFMARYKISQNHKLLLKEKLGPHHHLDEDTMSPNIIGDYGRTKWVDIVLHYMCFMMCMFATLPFIKAVLV